jgi:hypothetical protein
MTRGDGMKEARNENYMRKKGRGRGRKDMKKE